jgi:MarR family transcriptional regulator for hemolysin
MKSGDPNRQLEFVLNETARLMARIHNDRYRQVDINGTRVAALIYLQRSKTGMIQSELAERLEMGKAATGTMIDLLQADGLVERVPSPSDRRVRIVVITDEGREIVARAEEKTADIRRVIREGITKEERHLVIDILERMRTNLRSLAGAESAEDPSSSNRRHNPRGLGFVDICCF